MRKIRIGSGAGFGGDRIDPAVDLIEKGRLDYIAFECLAERTIAIAQQQMKHDPQKGYNDLLEARMEKVLRPCAEHKVKLITNMGAANPTGAATVIRKMASEMGLKGMQIAAIYGDNVLDRLCDYMDLSIYETGAKLATIESKVVSANAYIGASGIVEALEHGADVVVAGRVSDPALFLGPLMYEFGWSPDDYEFIGKGVMTGHLLECAAQISGGYFAEPGYQDVPELWRVGFPIGEVSENGDLLVTKLPDAGGVINRATCTEQLLYEIHDPSTYISPDGIADFSEVTMTEVDENEVLITGGHGRPGTGFLKVSIGYEDCFIGDGEISYGGFGARERAMLAADIVKRRIEFLKVPVDELRIDLIGVNSLYGDELTKRMSDGKAECSEVRLRIAARTARKPDAEIIGHEVESLYLNGPAGGGGVRQGVRDILSVASIFIPNDDVKVKVSYEEV